MLRTDFLKLSNGLGQVWCQRCQISQRLVDKAGTTDEKGHGQLAGPEGQAQALGHKQSNMFCRKPIWRKKVKNLTEKSTLGTKPFTRQWLLDIGAVDVFTTTQG